MKKIFYSILVSLLVTQSLSVLAQGFTKLKVDNKYGNSSSSGPLTPKNLDQDNSNGAAGDFVQLNGTDVDIREMIKTISALTGKNFIINDKVKGRITIISERPMTKEMAYEAFLSALEINGYTPVMTPSGLINIINQKDSLTKPIDLYKGNSPNTDQYITRIIQLSNISANEISTVLSDMVSKNGKLMAYPTTNSIIVTDTGSNIDHILKLVSELDQEGPQEVLDIINIVNADAKDIADKVNQIFEKEKDSKSRSVRSRRRRNRKSSPQLEDVQAISKVIADERTNSIIIMGTKRSILKVRALVSRLDRDIAGVEGTIHVYYLKYAKSKEVADVLSSLVQDSQKSSGKSSKSKSAQKKSGSVRLQGGVQVTADEATNSLIVVASPKDYMTIVNQVIAKLDIVRPQIYLEAVIMSLDVRSTRTLGVSGLGGLINSIRGNDFTAFGGVLPLSTTALSSIAGASGGAVGGLVSSSTIDFTLQDGSTVSVPSVSAIIQALATNTDANVLSTPSIMTLDNEEAQIQVGQEVPVPSGTTVSTGVTTFDVSRQDTGIILKITPQISENDTVRLNIMQEITEVLPSASPELGPTLDKKSVETVVLANNKQTIVIGGLIDDKTTIATQKVPLLGDIPVLGSLFRTRITEKEKSNLLVFITPYIVRERKDYLAIAKKKIEERNQFIDANYGKSQRKIIRKSIANHAKELLEFKCQNDQMDDPCFEPSSAKVPDIQPIDKPLEVENVKLPTPASYYDDKTKKPVSQNP